MLLPAHKNPIDRRLDRIRDAWLTFAENPHARLLCLRVADEERALVSAFSTEMAGQRLGELPDLFVPLSARFGESYGFDLCAEFTERARRHQPLDSQYPDAQYSVAWSPPPLEPGASGIAALRALLGSFAMHHALPGCLALLLTPSVVEAPSSFSSWLQQLISTLPPQLRIIALDDVRAPSLQPLLEREPVRVVVDTLDLHMARASREIGEESPPRWPSAGLDTPDGILRDLLVQLRTALARAELAPALELGQRALAVSLAQRWFAPAIPIHFALAVGLSGAQRFDEAERQYLEAENVALQGEQAGDAACRKLRLRARLARGALLVSALEPARAAQLYVDTLLLAVALGDGKAALDCHRLACFCFELAGRLERAWQAGMDGLSYAQTLDAQTLRGSSLPQLGEALLRLAEQAEHGASRVQVQRQISELMGRAERRAGVRSEADPRV